MPEPAAAPLARLRATLDRHPQAARLALWGSVAATVAGAVAALVGEILSGDPVLAQAGALLCLGAGGLYAGLRLLGVRTAGPYPGAAPRAERRRGMRRR